MKSAKLTTSLLAACFMALGGSANGVVAFASTDKLHRLLDDDPNAYFESIHQENRDSVISSLPRNIDNIENIVQAKVQQQLNGPVGISKGGPVERSGSRRLSPANDLGYDLLFCDVMGNAVWKFEGENAVTSVRETAMDVFRPAQLCSAKVSLTVSAYQSGCSLQNHPKGCNEVYYKGCGGLTVNPTNKEIMVARTGGRTIGKLRYKKVNGECQGQITDFLLGYKGKKFNSPTYAEYSNCGNLYFTDSPFGLANGPEDFEGDILDKRSELGFNGVYVLRKGKKEAELIDCTMDRPNKIAFSPKNDLMYVTNSRKGNSYVKVFKIKADGLAEEAGIFFNFTANPDLKTCEGYADGIKVNDQGNVYVAAHKGIYGFSLEGDLIGYIKSNKKINSLVIGGGKLFMVGEFGIVAQAINSSSQPSMKMPTAVTTCGDY